MAVRDCRKTRASRVMPMRTRVPRGPGSTCRPPFPPDARTPEPAGRAAASTSVVPTFCRHNRFLDRCPICSAEANEAAAERRGGSRGAAGRTATRRSSPTNVRVATHVRVRRELRASDDGYRSELVAGLRASADAERLAEEAAFASGRLLVLATAPPGP